MHEVEQDHPKLSSREREIMELAAEGFTDAGIAHKLGISEATVNTYWGRIRAKLGPYSRTELVALSLREEHERRIKEIRDQYEAQARQTRSSERSNEALFREIIKNAPDSILLVSGEGQVVYANEQASKMFGYKNGELTGVDLYLLIPERHRKAHAAHRRAYVENPEKRRMGEHNATPALRKDGKEFMIAASLSATMTKGGVLVTCVARELPENSYDSSD